MTGTEKLSDSRGIMGRVGGPTLVLGTLMLLGDILSRGLPTLEGLLMPFLGAYFLSLVMMTLADHLPFTVGKKAVAVFGLVYTVMAINVVLELHFFSTTPLPDLLLILFTSSWQLVPFSFAIARGATPPRAHISPLAEFRRLFGLRPIWAWGIRLPLALFAHILIYFIVGAVAYHFTAPYYNDPSLGLNLVVPSLGVILPLQAVRALIYLAAFLPLAAGMTVSRQKAGFLFGAVLFVAGALTPLLANTDWPVTLRFYHTVEGLILGFLAGWAMIMILIPPHRTRDEDPAPAAHPTPPDLP